MQDSCYSGSEFLIRKLLLFYHLALTRLSLLLCLSCLLVGCARSFTKPDITEADYIAAGSTAYKLDFDLTQQPLVLPEHFNNKLKRANMQLHAVRVHNSTADTVWLQQEDIKLLSNNELATVATPRQVYKTLKQPVAVHALWLLLGPFVRYEGEEKVLDYHPLGLASAAWGLRNGIVAYRANREVKELAGLYIPETGMPLPPGSTQYVLLPVLGNTPDTPLDLQYTESPKNNTTLPNEQ